MGKRGSTEARDALLGIYAAALDETAWPGVLRELAAALDSPLAVLVTIDKKRERMTAMRMSDEPGGRKMEWYPAEHDLLYLATRDQPVGNIHYSADHLPFEQLQTSPLYEVVLKPLGLRFHVAAIVENDEAFYTCFGFWYAELRQARNPRIANWLRDLVPHLSAAVRVSRRLREAQGSHWASLYSMQFSRHGIFLLNHRRQMAFANREGERILRSRDGISLKQGRLAFTDDTAQGHFDQFVGTAGEPPAGLAEGRFRASRRSRRLPYDVLVLSRLARSDYGRVRQGTAFIVVLSDPSEVFAIAKTTLMRHYGLTASEAQLCRALLRTGDLARAAVDSRIAVNTARTHLKRVFTKLQVSSQLQLLQYLGSSIRPPVVGPVEELMLHE
jgi:DNA-binding CsgD family transcriptional regulator